MRKIVTALTALLATAALGADHPCKEDAQKFCAGVEPGQGRIAQCLAQHEADLSAACKQKRDSFREQTEEIRAACEGDARKFCAGVEPGGGRIARCLQQHANELSDACRSGGEKLRENGEARREVLRDVQQGCRDDLGKFCSDVKPGGGRLARCLKSHQNELSQSCTTAIQDAKDR
jgi:Cysteine rich repeat